MVTMTDKGQSFLYSNMNDEFLLEILAVKELLESEIRRSSFLHPIAQIKTEHDHREVAGPQEAVPDRSGERGPGARA